MLINEIKPSSQLIEYVRLYRIIDFKFPRNITIPYKAYPPRPEHCLQFMLKDLETVQYPDAKNKVSPKPVIFMGPHTKVIHRFPLTETLGLQIIFQPASVHQLLGVASHELTNVYMDAELLFGNCVREVNEQLCYCRNYQEMINVAEKFLIRMIQKLKLKNHSVDTISRAMLLENDQFALDKFLKAACLSHRQVDRKFRERIGISPKQFLQLSRFDKAFRTKNRTPQKDWLSIALHCGYYDYQHLVKDYKEFTGYSPTQFFAIDSNAPERLNGDVEI